MRLGIISFTENGMRLSEYVAGVMEQEMEVSCYTKWKNCADGGEAASVSYVKAPVGEWTKKHLCAKDALLFIGACGIAVRAVAPHLTDKLHDPPALVMDEKGKYVIPILSGHMGGANALAARIAEKTGAEPVITTATDLNHKFAADLFAKRNGLLIENKDGIAAVSAKSLAGQEITVSIEEEYETDKSGGLPEGIRAVPYPPSEPVDILIAREDKDGRAKLLLKPRAYILGIGCKKGKTVEEIDGFLSGIIKKLGISVSQIYALASIAQKRKEAGIVAWCKKKGISFVTYTAEELQEVEGDFTESSFVREQVGVGNVCERAALKACGEGGKLILSKCAADGITAAAAKRNGMLVWDAPEPPGLDLESCTGTENQI